MHKKQTLCTLTRHPVCPLLQVRFVLDSESQNPTDVQMYALKETNALVEEFMLLANITVGKKILRWVHKTATLTLCSCHGANDRPPDFRAFL